MKKHLEAVFPRQHYVCSLGPHKAHVTHRRKWGSQGALQSPQRRRRRRTPIPRRVSISQHQGREHQRTEPENESLAGAADTPRAPGERRLGPFKINFEFKLLNVFSRRKEGTLQAGLAVASAGLGTLPEAARVHLQAPGLQEGREGPSAPLFPGATGTGTSLSATYTDTSASTGSGCPETSC